MKIPARVKIHIPPFHGIISPYDKMRGTAIALKENIDKRGDKTLLVVIRLDKPEVSSITTIGLPVDSLVLL